jgi:oligopeptide transport system substrate-binding protein
MLLLGGFGLRSQTERADFVYVNSSGINTLDPAAITWNQDIRVAINLWEGLSAYAPKTARAIPGAAYAPTVSDDGLIYTFTIRPDARWSNGEPVTSADFIRGWRRAIEPGTAADYAFLITDNVAGAKEYYQWRNDAVGQLSSMKPGSASQRSRLEEHAREMETRFARVGMEAVDDQAFRVTLRRPCPYFLDLCAFPTLMPIHRSIERLRINRDDLGLTREGLVIYDAQWTKPTPRKNGYPGLVTNGPYRLNRWLFKRRLRMVVNPHYRDSDSMACRTVDMLVFGDINTAIMAYEAGEVDFLPDTSVDYDHELARLSRSGQRSDIRCQTVFATYYYFFNCADESVDGRPNPFIDPRVRRAFALAIDKRVLSEKVIKRGDPPTDLIVPPGSVAGYVSPPTSSYDPNEARRLLAEAGYPGGKGLPVIDILYNTGFDHGKVCDVLARMWQRELGVVVSMRGKEVKTYAEDRRNRRFMIARAGWYGDYLDPTTFLDVFASDNGNNNAGYTSAEFDQLLTTAAQETDPKRRSDILSRAERILVDRDQPALPLYHHTQILAIKPYVRGLYPNVRLVFPFKYVSIER